MLIVQARLGSTRLPRKVLALLGEVSIIELIRRRTANFTPPLILTPPSDCDEIRNAIIPENCVLAGLGYDENDVYERFNVALRFLQDTEKRGWFVRICADSPFIDPEVIKIVAAAWKPGHICSNTRPRTWPAGQCVEVLPVKEFLEAADKITDTYDREHVSPWFYRNLPHINVTCPEGDFSHLNLCVDTAEDLERARAIVAKMDRSAHTYGWREIVELM